MSKIVDFQVLDANSIEAVAIVDGVGCTVEDLCTRIANLSYRLAKAQAKAEPRP